MVNVEITRRIRWSDADPAGRLHFPRIFEYVEEAEAELMRRIGYSPARDGYDLPRVHVSCNFRKVLSLDTLFTLKLSAGKLGRTSIQFVFQVFLDGAEGGTREIAAEGNMTVVVLRGGRPAEIPVLLRNALVGVAT